MHGRYGTVPSSQQVTYWIYIFVYVLIKIFDNEVNKSPAVSILKKKVSGMTGEDLAGLTQKTLAKIS